MGDARVRECESAKFKTFCLLTNKFTTFRLLIFIFIFVLKLQYFQYHLFIVLNFNFNIFLNTMSNIFFHLFQCYNKHVFHKKDNHHDDR